MDFIQYSAGMILKMRRKVFFFWMIAAHGFVRAAAGSWMAPGRGYLVYTGTGSHTLRLIEKDSPDEVDWIKFRTDGHPLPVYGPDGVKRGEILPGEGIPEEWPKGLYIIPYGKMMKK